MFFEKWKDLQVTVTDSTGQFIFVTNIGAAHTQGVEASLRVRPFEDVTLTSSATWIEARTDKAFQTASGNVPANTHLPGTPPFQIANVLSYQTQWRSVAPSMDVVHSRIGRSSNNLFGTQAVGGYDTFDAHVRMLLPNLLLQPEISVDLNNIGDKRGIAGAYADPSLSTRDIYFITPRTLAVTATLRL